MFPPPCPRANSPTCPCQVRPLSLLTHAVLCSRAKIPDGSSSCVHSHPTPWDVGWRVLTNGLYYLCLAGTEVQLENSWKHLPLDEFRSPPSAARSLPPSRQEVEKGSWFLRFCPRPLRTLIPRARQGWPRLGSALSCVKTGSWIFCWQRKNISQPFKASEKQEVHWKTGDPGIYYF